MSTNILKLEYKLNVTLCTVEIRCFIMLLVVVLQQPSINKEEFFHHQVAPYMYVSTSCFTYFFKLSNSTKELALS